MTPTEDLIQEHKAIKVMLSIMSKIAEDIKINKGFDTKDVEKIVDFLKTFADKCHHFSYGMIELPEGKMKSRE